MSKAILSLFEEYQKARLKFVQSITELSSRPQNMLPLTSSGALSLLKPLLTDPVQIIQQSAALAIGKLANYSLEIAESIMQNEIISSISYSISSQNRFYKKAACYVIKAVASHNAQLANYVVSCGVLEPLIKTLEEFDPSVKESAAWALGYIARHNAELATQVADAGAVSSLVICLQESEVSLKIVAAQTLSNIAMHNEKLASLVSQEGLRFYAIYISYSDMSLKRNICLLLGNIAKHSNELAVQLVHSFSDLKILISCLLMPDKLLKKNAAFCICEIVNKNEENALKLIEEGVLGALAIYIDKVTDESRLYGIIALGYIGGHAEMLSEAILNINIAEKFKLIMDTETSDYVLAAVCFALGQLGKHAPKHANNIAKVGILISILKAYLREDASEDLKLKAKRALKKIITNLTILRYLEPLLPITDKRIMKYIMKEFISKIPNDSEYKKEFAKRNGLMELKKCRDRMDDTLSAEIMKFIEQNWGTDAARIYSKDYKKYIENELDKLIGD